MEKYDLQTIGMITTFEKITRVNVKRFFKDRFGQLLFIVEEGHAGKAIGKAGMNIKKMQYLLKKKIKVVEYSGDPKEFIRNYLAPLRIDKIEANEETIEITSRDQKTKGVIIGRDRQNLKELNAIIKNLFKKEVKVLEREKDTKSL